MQVTATVARAAPYVRFAAAAEALVPEWVADTAAPPLLLAVSGGPDSLALLHLAATCYPARVAAMTVDHQLRPEAADEARFVAACAAEMNVPHTIATPSLPITGNIQSAARTARYALLQAEAERLGGAFICTAHHADDQLETMLMRLSRGSGVAGLSGIRPVNGRVIRPLLGFQKAELIALCETAGWTPVADPSNDDAHYDRVAMRQALARTALPITPDALSRTGKAMRDADTALQWAAEQAAAERLTLAEGEATLDPHDLPHEITRRLLVTALLHLNAKPPRGEQIETAIAALNAGKPASLGDILITPARAKDPNWHFAPAPPRGNGRNLPR